MTPLPDDCTYAVLYPNLYSLMNKHVKQHKSQSVSDSEITIIVGLWAQGCKTLNFLYCLLLNFWL